MDNGNNGFFVGVRVLYVLYTVSEVCRSRSTGVDSSKSWRFSTGAGAGLGVDFFDWNKRKIDY